MKKIRNSGTILVCEGTNISKLLNRCLELDITLQNAIRKDAKTLEFSIDDSNLKKFNTLDLKGYDVKVKNIGGKQRFKNLLITRCGLLIGLIISLIAIFFINNRMLNIQISGLSKYNEDEVINEINEFGLGYFSKMDINTAELESHLTNKFTFSFVSIITKGNTLIVNVKEEISDVTEKYLPITADYNMVITSINVYAGYSKIKVGDVIYKGDTIVYPYEIINEEKVSVVPMAEINGDVFFSSRHTFRKEETRVERTGNSTILNSSIYLGKNKIFEVSKDNPFSSFEVEEVEDLVSYYFLPIKIKKTIIYETTEAKVSNNFDEMKDKIIEDLKKDVYNKVPENLKVDSEEIQISSTNYGNIVTIYLKSSVYLNYK